MSWIINGVPAETIWRNGAVNGTYTVCFNKTDATLADIEGIDWAHPEVRRGAGNSEQFHCLPEGYGFKLDNVDYVGSLRQYKAAISVLAQYLGDVTGYQAEIAEQQAVIQTKDAEISDLNAQLAEADALVLELYEAQIAEKTEPAENAAETEVEA